MLLIKKTTLYIAEKSQNKHAMFLCDFLIVLSETNRFNLKVFKTELVVLLKLWLQNLTFVEILVFFTYDIYIS